MMDTVSSYDDQANAYENNVEMSSTGDQKSELIEHINQSQPFYLMRSTPRKTLFVFFFCVSDSIQRYCIFFLIKNINKKAEEPLKGSTNLILHSERQQAFKQYCCKKVKEPLAAFLPDFPGNIDITTFGDDSKETRFELKYTVLITKKYLRKIINKKDFFLINYSFG